jgi:hypothetical protein
MSSMKPSIKEEKAERTGEDREATVKCLVGTGFEDIAFTRR